MHQQADCFSMREAFCPTGSMFLYMPATLRCQQLPIATLDGNVIQQLASHSTCVTSTHLTGGGGGDAASPGTSTTPSVDTRSFTSVLVGLLLRPLGPTPAPAAAPALLPAR